MNITAATDAVTAAQHVDLATVLQASRTLFALVSGAGPSPEAQTGRHMGFLIPEVKWFPR